MIILSKENSTNYESVETLYNKQISSSSHNKEVFTKNYSSQKMIRGKVSTDRMKFDSMQIQNGYFYNAKCSYLHYSSVGLLSFQDNRNHPNFVGETN